MNDYHDISEETLKKLIYPSGKISSRFIKDINIIYADYIASGLLSPLIDNYMISNIYPYYANTHSNANNGILMKNEIKKTKEVIRKNMNLSDDYKIIFTGSGTTAAINQLINCIEFNNYDRVVIYLTLYEHYSNHLPWIELLKSNSNIKIKLIPFESSRSSESDKSNSGIIDLKWLESSIEKQYNNPKNQKKKTLIICSIIACSNVTGIVLPLSNIKKILDKFPKTDYFNKYFFADYACSAPYVKIDGSILDSLFFSPHKFIGGPSTPGVLIGKSCLFNKSKPFCAGGGCVKKVSNLNIEYDPDIEKRESAGTPNILGIIRINKLLKLKDTFLDIILLNESMISKLIKTKINYYQNKYPNFKSVLYNDKVHHLPILSFNLTNLHFNLIVVLFNDLFGIQTRGGISCCSLLADYIQNNYGYRGWCRISFHWLMSKKTINYIFDALEYIIKNGEKYIKYYDFIDDIFVIKK